MQHDDVFYGFRITFVKPIHCHILMAAYYGGSFDNILEGWRGIIIIVLGKQCHNCVLFLKLF